MTWRHRIDWAEVAEIDSAVHLKHDGTKLGLGRGDDRLRRYFNVAGIMIFYHGGLLAGKDSRVEALT